MDWWSVLSRANTGPIFSYKLRYIVGFGSVELVISSRPIGSLRYNLACTRIRHPVYSSQSLDLLRTQVSHDNLSHSALSFRSCLKIWKFQSWCWVRLPIHLVLPRRQLSMWRSKVSSTYTWDGWHWWRSVWCCCLTLLSIVWSPSSLSIYCTYKMARIASNAVVSHDVSAKCKPMSVCGRQQPKQKQPLPSSLFMIYYIMYMVI